MDEAIRLTDLRRRFGGTQAVDGLSLAVPRGSVFGLLGRNGAGKTTTIRMLMNLVRPDSGQVEVLGLDPRRHGVALRQRLGYVSESPQLYGWMRVRDLVRFNARFYPTWNHELATGLLARFGLDPQQRVRHLSRGMAAQLALVLALGHEPELLILDEPATGLDVLVRRDVLTSIVQLIQEEGRTVFLSSHLVHEVERVADRVAIVEGGRLLACATTDELKARTRRVLVRGQFDSQQLASVPGVTAVEGDGVHRLVTVSDFAPETVGRLQSAGAEVVEVMGLGLEDTFLALVEPHARRRNG
jgi:ABC-2 type transport system ATP-binding protein